MRLYRITHPDYDQPLNGEGARLYGGRWNPIGIPMLYYASSLSLSALEKRVHTPASGLLRRWRKIVMEVPDDLVTPTPEGSLPANWRDHPPPDELAEIGRRWAASMESLGRLVPSVIAPEDMNVLINPAHPQITSLRHMVTEDFQFDKRLAV